MAKTVEQRTDVYPAGYFMYCILFSLTHYVNGLFTEFTLSFASRSHLLFGHVFCPTHIHWFPIIQSVFVPMPDCVCVFAHRTAEPLFIWLPIRATLQL